MYSVCISTSSAPWQDQTSDQPPAQLGQGSHPTSSPHGSPTHNGIIDKYQSFGISEKEGESDVDEEAQLIKNDGGLENGGETVTVETTEDLSSQPKTVCLLIMIIWLLNVDIKVKYVLCVYRKRELSPCYKLSEFL